MLSTFTSAAGSYASEFIPPPEYPLKKIPTPTLSSPPVSALTMGKFVVKLETTSLEKVLKTIKAGKIAQRGDASESLEWICYSITDQYNPVRLCLLSGEIDSGNVGTIVISSMSRKDKTSKKCPELPESFKPVKLDRNIWVHTTESDVREILGKPSLESRGWLQYRSEQIFYNDPRAKAWDEYDWTVYGSLGLRIRSGKVVEMWATKQEEGSSSEFEPHPLQEYLRRMP